MRSLVLVVAAFVLVGMAPRPAEAQWIPALSPSGAVTAPEPAFPGVTTPRPASAPVAVPPAGPPGGVAQTPGAPVLVMPPPEIPDSTFLWLNYYSSPSSPYFLARPMPPPAPTRPRTPR